jgi:hypothetical protein
MEEPMIGVYEALLLCLQAGGVAVNAEAYKAKLEQIKRWNDGNHRTGDPRPAPDPLEEA